MVSMCKVIFSHFWISHILLDNDDDVNLTIHPSGRCDCNGANAPYTANNQIETKESDAEWETEQQHTSNVLFTLMFFDGKSDE